MKTLQVIETAYRATIEEQDDPVLWITQAMRGAGAEFVVLLRGNAVSYAAPGQNAAGLRIGSWSQRHPPDVAGALGSLSASGVEIFAVEEDLEQRGIPFSRLVEGVKTVSRGSLASLYERCARVWHW